MQVKRCGCSITRYVCLYDRNPTLYLSIFQSRPQRDRDLNLMVITAGCAFYVLNIFQGDKGQDCGCESAASEENRIGATRQTVISEAVWGLK